MHALPDLALNARLLALASEDMIEFQALEAEFRPARIASYAQAAPDRHRWRPGSAWCSCWMHRMAERAGADHAAATVAARSWLRVGQAVEFGQVMPGDVAVFWRGERRGWKGHVGILLALRSSSVIVLGGNQGGEVRVSVYPRSRLLGCRRLVSRH